MIIIVINMNCYIKCYIITELSENDRGTYACIVGISNLIRLTMSCSDSQPVATWTCSVRWPHTLSHACLHCTSNLHCTSIIICERTVPNHIVFLHAFYNMRSYVFKDTVFLTFFQ